MAEQNRISDESLRARMDTVVQMAQHEMDTEIETPLHLMEVLTEQAWHELSNALRWAQTGWSIGVENALRRLIMLLRYVELRSVDRIPYPMIHSGMYEQVLDLAGYTNPAGPEDWAQVQEKARQYMEDQRA